MAVHRTFLNQPYGAYHNREVPREDEELTHVGPGTPGGEYLRRFWQPVAYAEDLKDLPLAVRIMGEDLVLFRDRSGRIGLLQRHCSHRGTSLEFGIVSERGIRCCYHGWLFDVDGRILETPNEPADRTLKDRLCHGAYPVHEYRGLVFAYMGPPHARPPFPVYDTFELPGYRLERGQLRGIKSVKPCNWLQIQDNVVDLVHEAFLHARVTGVQFIDQNGRPMVELADVGELAFTETPIGLLVTETRRVGEDIWARTIEHICPNVVQIARTPILPPTYNGQPQELAFSPFITRWRVPIDDTNTLELSFVRLAEDEPNTYIDAPPPVTLSNYGGRPYEEQQRSPGDYEAQVGQRPIAIHALEHLTSTDRGVIMFRRMVRQGIRAVQRGEDPKGLCRDTGGTISTYGHDRVLRVAPAATAEEDRDLLRQAAQRVIERTLQNPSSLRRVVRL
jgi:phenylpropionate dioxygenase-like ring-hydroxylating dioxygenase large terminal subunit